jgi:hypothetical protein
VTNWDGNRLRGNFYTFQIGTVKFISLDADDIIYRQQPPRSVQRNVTVAADCGRTAAART